MDDIEDEVLLIASQNAEQDEKNRTQSRQQNLKDINATYDLFSSNASGTSTQINKIFKSRETKTEQIKQDFFIDLTLNSDSLVPQHNGHLALNPSDRQPFSTAQSSQKENISSQQALMKQENKIKALEIQLRNEKSVKADLQEQIVVKNGENSNLRRDKKILDDKLITLNQKLKESTSKNPETELSRKNEANKTIHQFQKNEDFKRNPTISKKEKLESRVRFFTNFPLHNTTQKLEVSSKAFDISMLIPGLLDSADFEETLINIETQCSLAKVCAKLLNGGYIDSTSLDELFAGAASTILHILYVERQKNEDIVFDNPSLAAYTFISNPCLRAGMTSFDCSNSFKKDYGFSMLLQAEKLYPEETCLKTRRIIACYSALARSSRQFSEKLLLDAVDDDEGSFRTFVLVLFDTLTFHVAESNNVVDYFGFAIAAANLLSSLGSHFSEYNLPAHKTINESLMKLFRAVLECRCDDPLLMTYLSDFLVYVTTAPEKTDLVRLLCVNYPSKDIDLLKMYKISEYPPNACSFQLFLMYLLTAFNFGKFPNRLELDLLLKTTLNLSQITSNIQEMKEKTLRCLDREEKQKLPEICGCYSTLIQALLTLNHRSLANRSLSVTQILQVETFDTQIQDDHHRFKKPEFSKRNMMACSATNSLDLIVLCLISDYILMKEIVRNCITSIADLFMRIGFMDFPLENLVFSNQLEQICSWIKDGKFFDTQNHSVDCWDGYDCTTLGKFN